MTGERSIVAFSITQSIRENVPGFESISSRQAASLLQIRKFSLAASSSKVSSATSIH